MNNQQPAAANLGAAMYEQLAQRRYESLRQQEGVTPYDLVNGAEQSFDLQDAKPMADIDGRIGIVASLEMGGDSVLHVWGALDAEGKVKADLGLIVSAEDFDPARMTKDESARSVIRVVPNQAETVIGRDKELESAQLFHLSGFVSRKHLGISLHDGKVTVRDLSLKNGTQLLLAKSAETASDKETKTEVVVAEAGEMAVEHTLNAEQSPATGVAAEQPAAAEADQPGRSLAEVFSSGASLEQALQDPANVEMAHSLQQLEQAWQEVRLASLTEEVYGEVVQPRLREFRDVLPQLMQDNRNLLETTDVIAQHLEQAAKALDYDDREGFTASLQYLGANGALEAFDSSPLVTPHSSEVGEARRVSAMLDGGVMESDERIMKVAGGSKYARLSPEDYDKLAAQVEPLAAAGHSLEDIIANVRSGLPESAGSWKQRQELIQEAVSFGRVAAMGGEDFAVTLQQLRNHFDLVREDWHRQRYDATELRQLSYQLRVAGEALNSVWRFMAHANMFASEVR